MSLKLYFNMEVSNLFVWKTFSVTTICLGGTRQVGNFSTELDPNDRDHILRRCKELCPSLAVILLK